MFTAANVRLTMAIRLLLALLLTAQLVGAHPAGVGARLVWSMPVVVAVQVWYWITNFENGVPGYAPRSCASAIQHDWYATTFCG